jgi:hypothetical protein
MAGARRADCSESSWIKIRSTAIDTNKNHKAEWEHMEAIRRRFEADRTITVVLRMTSVLST